MPNGAILGIAPCTTMNVHIILKMQDSSLRGRSRLYTVAFRQLDSLDRPDAIARWSSLIYRRESNQDCLNAAGVLISINGPRIVL